MKTKAKLLVSIPALYIFLIVVTWFPPEPISHQPITSFLTNLRQKDQTNQLTAANLNKNVRKEVWVFHQSRAAWLYDVKVTGTNTDWTITFTPRPLSISQRVWLATMYWEFAPRIPAIFAMDSRDKAIRCIREDGSEFRP